jgi:hypothetical protein
MENKSSSDKSDKSDKKVQAFTVRANPILHDSGDLAGKLDYVRFTADIPNGPHKEWRLSAAQLDKKLHILESSGMRYQILSKLQSGARADLPGTYSTKQLADLGLRTSS